MNKRIAVVGVMMVCVLAASGVMASGAAAAPTESNTVWTCTQVVGGKFFNKYCDPGRPKEGTKEFALVVEKLSLWMRLRDLANSIFKTTIGGSEVVITSTGVECVECMIENHEETVEGKTVMDAVGSGGHLRFTGVTINLPSCTVTGSEINTEALKLTTTTASTALFEPVTGSTVAVIHLNAGCAIGSSITVTGLAKASLTGAVATFKTGASELKVGKQTATLEGEMEMSGGITGGSEFTPFVLQPA